MLAEERQAAILQQIQMAGVVRTRQIARELSASTETIRKDLDELSKKGLLTRVHGGAISHQGSPLSQKTYRPFAEREVSMLAEKQKIARLAAELVADGSSLILDSGTSSYELARILVKEHRRLTVLTNSLKTALLLSERSDFTTILTGGVVTSDEKSLVSSLAHCVPQQLRLDKMFLSTSGVSAAAGVTDQRLEEVVVHRQLISSAEQLIVLADHSKLGQRSLIHVCPLDSVDILITDSLPEDVPIDDILECIGDLVVSDADRP